MGRDVDAVQQTLPTGDGWIHVVRGPDNACALDAVGSVRCFGVAFGGQLDPPDGTWEQLTVGRHHACALDASGTPTCWGLDLEGETQVPPGLTGLVEVQAAEGYTCGQQADGRLICWGTDEGDQPVPIAPLSSFAVGREGGIGIDAATGAYVDWGSFGLGHDDDLPPGLTGLRRAGLITCGIDAQDQLQCASNTNAVDIFPEPMGAWQQVDITDDHFACALDLDGMPTCWGDEVLGVPVPSEPFVALSAGSDAACGLREDGSATCWGPSRFGQLRVPDEQWRSIGLGDSFGCGLTEGGAIRCWGTPERPFD